MFDKILQAHSLIDVYQRLKEHKKDADGPHQAAIGSWYDIDK